MTSSRLLAEVAARGVKVRLLFDHIGTARIPGYRDMIKKLKQTAIEWHPMLPIQPLKGKWRRPDLRNHRKIVVVDGRVAFVGSLNMIDAQLPQSQARASRPEVARVGHGAQRTSGLLTRHRLRHRLVPRDRTRCFVKTCSLTRTRWNPAMWCARSSPADRVSRTRTTFDCSTR